METRNAIPNPNGSAATLIFKTQAVVISKMIVCKALTSNEPYTANLKILAPEAL